MEIKFKILIKLHIWFWSLIYRPKSITYINGPSLIIKGKPWFVQSYLKPRWLIKQGGDIYIMKDNYLRGFNIPVNNDAVNQNHIDNTNLVLHKEI